MEILKALLIFSATFITDAIWALCVKYVADKKALKAANYGTFLYLTSAYAVLIYTKEPIYLVPSLMGAWLGTYLTVKYSK